MKKFFVSMVIFAFASLLSAGCGGGGGSTPATPTTTVMTSAGSARITSAQNAGANILMDDFTATGWKVLLPAGTLAADTTFTFANIVPGSGGVPAIPANIIMGILVEITATPAIPSNKTITIINDDSGNTDIATGNTVDLMKVILGSWTDIGNATKYSDGTLRADVSGLSQIALTVRDATGTYTDTLTITSSTNANYCGTIGSVDTGDNIVAQNGVVMTFNPNDPNCVSTGKMGADGVFTGTATCTELRTGCTVNTSRTFAGVLDISANPKQYSATVSTTSTFSGACSDAPASCTMTGTAAGVLQ